MLLGWAGPSTPTVDSQGPAGSVAALGRDPPQGHLGSSQHSAHPVREGGAEGLGVQRQSLAPSGVLEKLIPKDTRPWLHCPQKAAREPGVGVEQRWNSRDHLGG